MSIASNPGRNRIDFGQFYRCFPREWMTWAAGIVLGLILLPFSWKLGAIVCAVALGSFLFTAKLWSDVFQDGDVCPAIVLDHDRQLVAVATDLSQTDASLWQLKVLRQPLDRATGGPFEVKTRLAAIATYKGQPGQDAWTDFTPVVINCGTIDNAAIERAFNSIPSEDWDRLQQGLQSLERPFETGMYDIAAG